MVMANSAFGIDKVVRRPILVVEDAPDRVVIVERDNDYFQKLSREWSRALRKAFTEIEDFDI